MLKDLYLIITMHQQLFTYLLFTFGNKDGYEFHCRHCSFKE